jgi:hypothetical protein
VEGKGGKIEAREGGQREKRDGEEREEGRPTFSFSSGRKYPSLYHMRTLGK